MRNSSHDQGSPNIEHFCSMFECLFMFGEHLNTRIWIYEKNSRTFKHSDSKEQMKIRTPEHFNVQDVANITEHSNMNVRRSVAPARDKQLMN